MSEHALDDRDIAILSILAREGRISKTELSRRVNLSATPCWQRLKKLEAAGLITGYHADIALTKLGPHVVVFVTIELENHRAENFQTFERTIARYEEVTACWAIGGGFDYLLQVTTRDIGHYQDLIDAMLDARIGLKRYFSYIVTKAIKSGGAPPFDLLVHGAPSKG